jgi:hypothetical protein
MMKFGFTIWRVVMGTLAVDANLDRSFIGGIEPIPHPPQSEASVLNKVVAQC